MNEAHMLLFIYFVSVIVVITMIIFWLDSFLLTHYIIEIGAGATPSKQFKLDVNSYKINLFKKEKPVLVDKIGEVYELDDVTLVNITATNENFPCYNVKTDKAIIVCNIDNIKLIGKVTYCGTHPLVIFIHNNDPANITKQQYVSACLQTLALTSQYPILFTNYSKSFFASPNIYTFYRVLGNKNSSLLWKYKNVTINGCGCPV